MKRGVHMQKRADLSMSTIVMAVLAVLILIILSSVIIRNLGESNQQISSCENKGGICSFQSCAQRTDGFNRAHPTWTCDADVSGALQNCCIPG